MQSKTWPDCVLKILINWRMKYQIKTPDLNLLRSNLFPNPHLSILYNYSENYMWSKLPFYKNKYKKNDLIHIIF